MVISDTVEVMESAKVIKDKIINKRKISFKILENGMASITLSIIASFSIGWIRIKIIKKTKINVPSEINHPPLIIRERKTPFNMVRNVSELINPMTINVIKMMTGTKITTGRIPF